MNKKFPLIILVLIILISGFAIGSYAQVSSVATSSALGLKEVKSLDIATDFNATILANTNYSKLFSFSAYNFPDGIDHIISSYGLFVYEKQSAFPQTWRFYLNGTECINSVPFK